MHIYTAHAPVVSAQITRPEKSPLTAHSRGRGNWDCVRQMQMYRRRPDVLAAALRDMGCSDSGDEIPDVETTDCDESPTQRENSLN